jgi:hypothetical protein
MANLGNDYHDATIYTTTLKTTDGTLDGCKTGTWRFVGVNEAFCLL